jgi:UDP-N-acetylmuramate dehydrogenase
VFEAAAGEDWDKFVALAVAHNCAGIECLSGIPGNVGGTPVQNVGAYGQEVANSVESVQVLDLKDDQERELFKEDCRFNYRTSIFNTTERGRYIILQVNYALKIGGEPYIAYADLKKYFAGWSQYPTLADTREAVRQIRSTKAMLIKPGDDDCRSAGSFFKNPVLSAEQYEDLTQRAASRYMQVPSYPALDAQRKVYGTGSVGISRKHALAIVNRGSATASEVLALKDQIQHRVEEIWGVRLEPEPVFVGF